MLSVTLEKTVDLEGFDYKVRQAVAERFTELADKLYAKVMENVSGKILQKQTGKLAESVFKEVDTSSETMYAIVGVNPETPKALALEYGGKGDYPIFATKARALFFYWERLGRNVAFPYVNHPPSREFSYLRSALTEMEEVAVPEMFEALERSLAEYWP